ncbi:MAG: hypothetical protein IKN91_05245 [Paludibacteraceae bacterium]|nr:hypothetical protein [Paludibacteraceae bacterium]
MKRFIYILLLALTANIAFATQHADSKKYYCADNDAQEESIVVQSPVNIPLGITRIEVQITTSTTLSHRSLQDFVFSHIANQYFENKITQYTIQASSIVLAFPPTEIAFPFSCFW